jgi:hypothetical protein
MKDRARKKGPGFREREPQVRSSSPALKPGAGVPKKRFSFGLEEEMTTLGVQARRSSSVSKYQALLLWGTVSLLLGVFTLLLGSGLAGDEQDLLEGVYLLTGLMVSVALGIYGVAIRRFIDAQKAMARAALKAEKKQRRL